MAEHNEGVQAEEKTLSPEVMALAELGRTGVQAPPVDPNVRQQEPAKVRPDNVPEKFWNAETGVVDTDGLLKSYLELEKVHSAPKEPAKEEAKPNGEETTSPKISDAKKGEEKKPAEGEGETPAQVDREALQGAFTDARTAYAENNGELPEENRKAILDAGIPESVLDNYLAGIAAQEKALAATVYDLAGGADDYRAAVLWAAENWDEEEIAAYDQAIGNPKLVKNTVKGLMASFKEAGAPPSEGKQVEAGASAVSGDVYQSKDEFLVDLAKLRNITNLNEQAVARKAAVSKLERSKKAGTVKEVTPRSGPFHN